VHSCEHVTGFHWHAFVTMIITSKKHGEGKFLWFENLASKSFCKQFKIPLLCSTKNSWVPHTECLQFNPYFNASLRPLCSLERRELLVPRTRTTMDWPCLDPFPLLALPLGIAFHSCFFFSSNLFMSLTLLKTFFLELIELKALLLANGCWGRYINTRIQYNIMHAFFRNGFRQYYSEPDNSTCTQ